MNAVRSLKRWTWHITPSAIRLWCLERRTNSEFADQIKRARAKNDKDEIRRLEYEHRWNSAEIRDSRQARIQQKWLRKARKLMIPLPPQNFSADEYENEDWRYSQPSGEVLLKPQAMINLRREVRREQKERREAFTHWLTIVVGLVGALTGLVSVLMR